MKNFVIFLLLLISNKYYSQQYKLLPDSCTFCYYNSFTSEYSFIGSWSVLPKDTITINNNLYTKINGYNELYVRQVQNKLFGLFSMFTEERLIMDFDSPIGDTILDLYSAISHIEYSAIVLNKDSILLSNGMYHNFVELLATSPDRSIQIRWEESGLCHHNGGILNSFPRDSDLFITYNIDFCTTDPLYNSQLDKELCDSCILNSLPGAGLHEIGSHSINVFPNPTTSKIQLQLDGNFEKVIMIRDLIGNEVKKELTNDKKNSIDVDSLQNGIYFIEIVSNSKKYIGTFVKV